MGLRTMIYDSFYSSSKFSDIKNFPNGIQRCSYFTQMEADVLTRCGDTMIRLYNGDLKPENEDQKRLLDVLHGVQKPLYHIEYVFLKYLDLIEQEKNKTA